MVALNRPTPEEFELIPKVVGEPYPMPYPVDKEGYCLDIFGGQECFNITLQILCAGVSEKEIESIQTGDFEFALFTQDPLILWCVKSPLMKGWGDAPFCVAALPAEEREFPKPDGKRYLLTVDVIDIKTGILKALRAFSLSPEFSQAFYEAVERQRANGIALLKHNELVEDLYRVFDSRELAFRTKIRCKGGA